jgi:hypothetical protein
MQLLAGEGMPKHACVLTGQIKIAEMAIVQHDLPLAFRLPSAAEPRMSSHQPKHNVTKRVVAVCCCWLHNPAPGKTRCINHFLINNSWYLVDLPGYG